MIDSLLDKFTTHFKRILIQAQNIAWQEQSQSIDPVHLLEAMLQQKGCIGVEIMQRQNVTLNNVMFRTPERINVNVHRTRPNDFMNLPQPSSKSQKIIELAVKTSFEYRHKYVGSEHLLAGIVKAPDARIKGILLQHNVNFQTLLEQLETVLQSTSRFNSLPDLSDKKQREADHESDDVAANGILDLFTTNLTADRIQQDIDPVIGRNAEINRLIQILSRRTKNNPILLGDPGVGKTAIIEGLAKKITQGEVPDVLAGKKNSHA